MLFAELLNDPAKAGHGASRLCLLHGSRFIVKLTALFKAANALLDLVYDLLELVSIALAQVERKLSKERLDWRVMRAAEWPHRFHRDPHV